MLKKSLPWAFQRWHPKMQFPSSLQNQGLKKRSLILVARPDTAQTVFQQPAKDAGQ